MGLFVCNVTNGRKLSEMRKLIRFFGRLLAWIPVLWEDEDYDYAHLLGLMKFKISRMRKHIAEHSNHANAEKDVKRMRLAELLIGRILASDYGLGEHDKLCEKWGPLEFYPSEYGGSVLRHAKETPENKALIAEDVRRMVDTSAQQEEQDWDMLFSVLRKYLRHWWD